MKPISSLLSSAILAISLANAGGTLTPREDYERLRAEAAAALAQGKLVDATQLATRAFSQLPNGSKVSFHPGDNSVVVNITYVSSATHRMTLALPQFKAWLDEHDYWANFTPRQRPDNIKSTTRPDERRQEQHQPKRIADAQRPSIDPASVARANGGHASINGWQTVVTPESVGTSNPQYRWERVPPAVRNDPRDPFAQFDPQDVAVALAMFPQQGPEMWQWLKDQKNIKLDRQRGNSYSIGIR
jgi:hypothetical protein